MASRRKDRLESLLHREIAECLAREITDPRLGFITITRTELSRDMGFITAFYTILGDEKQKKSALHALKSARSFVQRSYAKHIRARSLPQLKFAFDERDEKRMNMDLLIREARASDPNSESDYVDPEAPDSEQISDTQESP
ncbi:MAG: 30S ribosome-binding factor RbfA [Planctomycetes bacterium]|nr:30S ribosome-binding factor RbfA [Planctomycetota bacterium]